MKCPHCDANFHDEKWEAPLNEGNKGHQADAEGIYWIKWMHCPSPTCNKRIIWLSMVDPNQNYKLVREVRVWPKAGNRRAPSEVSPKLAGDFNEAVLVLGDSSKASAALSRRCLQALLRERAGANQKDLAPQIEHVLNSKALPTYLANDLDAIRAIGNFAAHPLKSTSSGEILEVEPGEAEWNLDVLEGLFDFYYVEPALAAAKRSALNQKLAAAGKPPIQQPPP